MGRNRFWFLNYVLQKHDFELNTNDIKLFNVSSDCFGCQCLLFIFLFLFEVSIKYYKMCKCFPCFNYLLRH